MTVALLEISARIKQVVSCKSFPVQDIYLTDEINNDANE